MSYTITRSFKRLVITISFGKLVITIDIPP
jgi:hypothetical protein